MMVATNSLSPTPNIVMDCRRKSAFADGLGTTIHEFAGNHADLAHRNSWMVGPSPTMTEERVDGPVRPLHGRRRT
jgi:hypothetical protein